MAVPRGEIFRVLFRLRWDRRVQCWVESIGPTSDRLHALRVFAEATAKDPVAVVLADTFLQLWEPVPVEPTPNQSEAVRQAVLAEREACARFAESHFSTLHAAGTMPYLDRDLAAYIRMRHSL